MNSKKRMLMKSIDGVIIPTGNIVAYYEFEDNGNDETGNHNGTPLNLTYNPVGKINKSAIFNNSTSIVSIPDSNDLSFGNGITDSPFSISTYIKFYSLGGSIIVDKRIDDAIGGSGREYVFQYDGFGRLNLKLFDQSLGGTGGQLNARYTWTPIINQWYHVVATYDGSSNVNGMDLYVDNIDVTDDRASLTYVAMENHTGTVNLGKYFPSTTFTLDGELDGLVIWNKKLTQEEINVIYQRQNNGQKLF